MKIVSAPGIFARLMSSSLAWLCTSPDVPENTMKSLGTDRSSACIAAPTSRHSISSFRHSALDLRKSSALPVQPDIAVSARDLVHAAHIYEMETEHIIFPILPAIFRLSDHVLISVLRSFVQ